MKRRKLSHRSHSVISIMKLFPQISVWKLTVCLIILKLSLKNDSLKKIYQLMLHIIFQIELSCSVVSNSIDCSLPGSSVHGISQARIPEQIVIFFSRGSSQPRDRIRVSVSCNSCIGRQIFYHLFYITEPPGKPSFTQLQYNIINESH